MKKVIYLSALILILFSSYADAQKWRTRRWEAYYGLGTANIYGDIGGAQISSENLYGFKDYQIKFTRPSLAFGGKYKVNHRVYARVNFAGAFLQGDDTDTQNAIINPDPLHPGRKGGYAFKSWVVEPSVMGEFYIIPESRSMVSDAIYNRRGMVNGFRLYNVYLFAGVGAVVNFPTVWYMQTGEILVTDDYQRPEDSFQRAGLVLPVGIGVRTDLTSYWTIGVELGRRYTFTDYVDGYTSQFSTASDTYDFVNVTMSYRIRTDKNGWPVIFRKTGLN